MKKILSANTTAHYQHNKPSFSTRAIFTINLMISNRFQPGNLLGKGSFASVYQGVDTQTQFPVAIKQTSKRFRMLFKIELQVLTQLSGKSGFPKLICQGPTLTHKIKNEDYSTVDICDMVQQLIKILKKLHGKSYLHKDIKPENVLTGLKNNKKYHLVDFGLAKKYIDLSNNFHMLMRNNAKFKGNLIFCSNNVLAGIEASRRDDVTSVLLIAILMARRGLPWTKDTLSVEMMIKSRSVVGLEELMRGVPYELAQYYSYSLSLGFYQKPDYKYMIQLLGQCKNFCLQERTEVIMVRSKKHKRKTVKISMTRSKTEVDGIDEYTGTCSTIKVQAPDFSNTLRKQINQMKKTGQEETLIDY